MYSYLVALLPDWSTIGPCRAIIIFISMRCHNYNEIVLIFLFIFCRYALEVGELSGPVVSDSGIHIIMRTG